MALPSKEEVKAGDFEVDQENYRADMEAQIQKIIDLAKEVNRKRGERNSRHPG